LDPNIQIDNLNESGLRDYLTKAMDNAEGTGFNLKSLGEEGLSNETDLFGETVTKEDLKRWAEAVFRSGNEALVETYQEAVEDAKVLNYKANKTVTENAELASEDTNAAKALLLQAIESEGVPEALIERLTKAIEKLEKAEKEGTPEEIKAAKEEIKGVSKQVSKSADKIIKANAGRDAMVGLIERVTDALYETAQKEIDALADVNDALSEAAGDIVGKLQEQINKQREARKNEESKKNLNNLYS
jgi:hypothetical protein